MKHALLSALGSAVITGSLSAVRVLQATGREPPMQILPGAHVITIAGQSGSARGHAAVFSLIGAMVEPLGQHDMTNSRPCPPTHSEKE